MVVLGVVLLGVLIASIGLTCLVSPDFFKRMLKSAITGRRLYLISLFRLCAGTFLVVVAPNFALVELMMAFGSLLILSGLIGLMLGPQRLRPMVHWWLSQSNSMIRLWALVAAAVGGLLTYAAIGIV